jgi:hypothetical protein
MTISKAGKWRIVIKGYIGGSMTVSGERDNVIICNGDNVIVERVI